MTRPDIALLILRLAGLGLAYAHGWGKLTRLVAGDTRFAEAVAQMGFPAPLAFAWAAALTETLGGVLITLGLGTRIAASLGAFTMGVAAFLRHHAHEQLLVNLGLRSASEDTLKAWGNPELALLYLAIFVAIAIAGAGRISLDAALPGRRSKTRKRSRFD